MRNKIPIMECKTCPQCGTYKGVEKHFVKKPAPSEEYYPLCKTCLRDNDITGTDLRRSFYERKVFHET